MERARPLTSAVRSETGSSPPESTAHGQLVGEEVGSASAFPSAVDAFIRLPIPPSVGSASVRTASGSYLRRRMGGWVSSAPMAANATISIDLHSVPSRVARNGHPTDRCSCCSSGTVGRPTSTRSTRWFRFRPGHGYARPRRDRPDQVRGRASKEPRRVGAGYRRPTGRTPRHGLARLSRHRTRIQGEVGMMRLRLAREWGRGPPSLDDVMIAGRRRDPSVSVTLRLAHAPSTYVLLLISHRE